MEVINTILKTYDPISLSEMDNVKLLDRTDTKFLFNIDNLANILTNIKADYRVLNIQDFLISEYETLYYDTSNFDLYLLHHNGRLNRYKIRFRKYVQSNLHYFEIKFKNNKERTIKNRIKRPEIEVEIKGKAKKFLQETTPLSTMNLKPVLYVNYSRITLVGKNYNERLTIDLNLTFKNENCQKVYEPLVIAELKQECVCRDSPFAKEMSYQRIKSNSMSKYCFGVTQLFPEIKRNNFKPKLLTLNKILYANS